MSDSARPWLPEEAFSGPLAVAPLAALLDDWAAQWFTAGRATLPYRWMRQERGLLPGFAAHSVDAQTGFELALTPRGEGAFAAALLGQHAEHTPVHSAGDAALLRHVAQTARDDLARRVAEWIAPAVTMAAGRTGRIYRLPITLDDDTEIATLCVAEPVLIAAARLRRPPSRARSRVQPWRDALGTQNVTLSPVIGRSRITLAELEKLGPGDVIPLDTPVIALLDLAIGAATRAAQACSIALAQGHFEIRIERSPQEW